MRILLTGGGTGGHIYPALTIADEIRRLEPAAEFLFVGVAHGLEADLVPRAGLPFAAVRSGGLVRTGSLQRVLGLARAAAGTVQALGLLRRFRPRVVLATGGYVAGPVLLAARALGVPYALWEGNAFPGVTVRLFSRAARAVFIPYAEVARHFPSGAPLLALGNPVRREILAGDRRAARQAAGLAAGDQLVLAFGGSGGARAIHEALVGAVPQLLARPRLRLLHVTGPRQHDDVRRLYAAAGLDLATLPGVRVEPYLYDMPAALAAADLAVTRAGATTMAELAVCGLPAVVVPLPGVSHDHQDWNARALERRGGVVRLPQSRLTPQSLAAEVAALLDNPSRRAEMSAALRAAARPDAGPAIAARILAIARGRVP